MRSGSLDRIITIRRRTETLDGYRNPVETVADVATVRAQRIDASTEDFQRTGGVTSDTAVVYRTRFLEGVRTADIVVEGSELFEIVETKEIGRRRGLELRTIARAAT